MLNFGMKGVCFPLKNACYFFSKLVNIIWTDLNKIVFYAAESAAKQQQYSVLGMTMKGM